VTENLHRQIKEAAGVYRKSLFSNVENHQGELEQDDHQRKIIWENYISNLFADAVLTMLCCSDLLFWGPPITKEEIIRAINTTQDRKAIGPDCIPVELLKLDDKSITVLQTIFNKIYNTVEYPAKWLTSNFVPLPKKNNATKCEDHKLISLMSHTLKIFLKNINKVRKKHRIHTIWIQTKFRHSNTDSELQRSEKGHNAVFYRL